MDPPPLLGLHLHRRDDARDPGTVDEDVDPAEAVDRRGEAALRLGRVGDVEADRLDAPGADRAAAFSASACVRSATTTAATSCAKSRAQSWPIPPAPVTKRGAPRESIHGLAPSKDRA